MSHADASSYARARTAYLAGEYGQAARLLPSCFEASGYAGNSMVARDDFSPQLILAVGIQRSFLIYLYRGTNNFDAGDPQQALLLAGLKNDQGAMQRVWHSMQQPGVPSARAAIKYRAWVESQLGDQFCQGGECWDHLTALKTFLDAQSQIEAEKSK